MQRFTIALASALVLFLTACGAPSTGGTAATSATAAATEQIQVEAAWARPVAVGDTATTAEAGDHSGHGGMMATDTALGGMNMSGMNMGGPTGAAYMTISNAGSAADQLIQATTDVADSVEIHNTTIENNVAQMRPVAGVEVPANGQVELKPGSYHLMLINVKRTLQPGDTVPLTLTFQNAGTIQVDAEVRNP